MNEQTIEEVITGVITLNEGLRAFWNKSHGWAPQIAADLLTKSRLDWQVSLSTSLRLWIGTPTTEMQSAVQILGYANLGALVENTLKLFLSIYLQDYLKLPGPITSKGVIQQPDEIKFNQLREYFKKKVWKPTLADDWDPWIAKVQSRRNAIHAFKDKDIGTHAELLEDIRRYRSFLRGINQRLPYPDPH
jgi:hypothetical protein